MRVIRYCLTLLLLLPACADAQSLRYSLSGVDGEVARNVRAWLGAEPETVRERQQFVALARSRVASALEALGYYRPHIDIHVERREPEWLLDIAVEPGDPVRIHDIDIELSGAAADDPAFARLRDNPGFASGDILHHGRYEDFRRSLLSLAQQRGYFDAQITQGRVAVDTGAGRADVSLTLDSGRRYRFGEFIYDEELVSEELLRALSGFEPGDFYRQDLLRDLQSRVQGTGYFAAVLLEPEPAQSRGDSVPISVSLQSARRHSFDVGIGYSTDTEERVSLSWRTPRINRWGHSQLTRVIYSRINPSGRINYNIPLTHPLNDILQLWGRVEENEFGDLDSIQQELGTRRELRRGKWVTSYSLRQLSESWDLLSDTRTNDYLLLGASLSSRLQRGEIIDPEGGFSQLYSLEAGDRSLGSDVDLVRFTALLRYVYTLAPRHRLVGRTELGYAGISDEDRAELAPSLNFFAGGTQSIRGFSYQSIGNEVAVTRSSGDEKTLVVGGDRLAVTSVEYQYYFSDKWRGALFADAGDAFDSGEFDWHYGAGFGIHYLSPVGAVRVELANSLSESNPDWRLHLNIGAEF